MKFSKKALSLLLAAITLHSMSAAGTMSVFAYQNDKLTSNAVCEQIASNDSVSGDYIYRSDNGNIVLVKYLGDDTEVNIPSEFLGRTVTAIDTNAFKECSFIERVTVPSTVTRIGSYSFQGCTNLKNISIPYGVTAIEAGAFQDCQNLEDIPIPESVTTIGSGVFWGCNKITEINIPASVTTLIPSAIGKNESIVNINADENNPKFSSQDGILFSKDKKRIAAFPPGRKGTYEIPENVEIIGSDAFFGCEYLTQITVPDSVKSILSDAFEYCNALTTIILPEHITEIPLSAFCECRNLAEFKIPSSVTKIGNAAFANCKALTKIEIPQSVNKIENSAFSGCSRLTEIKLPSGITSVEGWTFSNCHLMQKIEIPASVKSIEQSAFYNCRSLTDVFFAGSEEDWQNITVGNNNDSLKNANIHFNYAETSVTLNKSEMTLGLGQTYTIKAEITPQDSNVTLTWKSSNKNAATVNSKGKISAKGEGRTTITVKTSDGKTASCKITVKKAPDSVSLNKTSAILGVKQTCTLQAELTPSDSYTYLNWSSSDSTIVSVDKNGRVTAKKVGTAVVTVKTSNGKYAHCTFTVKKAPDSVALSKNSLTLSKGKTEILTAALSPSNSATYCSWSSSNTSVATVTSGGKITAKAKGNAVITVRTSNGKTSYCDVTIK